MTPTCSCGGATRSSPTPRLRSDRADGRQPTAPVRLQQRLPRIRPARGLRGARAARRQPRIHRRAADVPRHRHGRRERGKKVIETAPLTKEQVDIEMAAHGGTVVEIRKVDGKWQVVTDSPYNRRITADTRDGDHRSGCRPRSPEDQRRRHRHEGARHDQQLRWRRDALGHLHHRPRRISTVISRASCPADHPEAAAYKRYGVPEGAYEWGEPLRPLRRQQGAERAESLRLDRRDRPDGRRTQCRRSAPLSAAPSTRAPSRSWRRTDASSSISATTSASTTFTSS